MPGVHCPVREPGEGSVRMAVRCAVLGSGNIGTDLMMKLRRSADLELTAVCGVDPASEGLARARDLGYEASTDGVEWILAHPDAAQVVFDATSASAHRANAPRLAEAGLRCLDLTPAKLGPGVVPVANLDAHLDAPEVNLITCGGQATIPMVAAVAQVVPVPYAEIVATIASASAGPGTRNNIDEFTAATARGLEEIGGAERGKAIIVLNPADPPLLMRNTVYCAVPADANEGAIAASVAAMRDRVAAYVPGYRLRTDPVFDHMEGPGGADDGGPLTRVAVFLEVEGAGDFLPAYAGNLDIMTSAAVAVGEAIARHADAPVAA